MVPRAIRAGRADDWSEALKSDELNPWTRVNEVRQDEDQHRSTVQRLMPKSTDFLRRIIVPVIVIATAFRLNITSGGSRRGTWCN